MINETILCEEALDGIKKYCEERQTKRKCNNCRYSIKKLSGNYSEYLSCIFANCPDSWRLEKK